MIQRMSDGIDFLNEHAQTGVGDIESLAVTTDGRHLETYKFIHVLAALHVYDVAHLHLTLQLQFSLKRFSLRRLYTTL